MCCYRLPQLPQLRLPLVLLLLLEFKQARQYIVVVSYQRQVEGAHSQHPINLLLLRHDPPNNNNDKIQAALVY
jgi:hypothetical protein